VNSWNFKGLLAAAIALPVLGGAAWAGGAADLGCSNATLKGAYAFSVLTVAAPPGFPNVVVGLVKFDGSGGLTQMDYAGGPDRPPFKPVKQVPTWSIRTAPALKRSIWPLGSS
jgi:hypothetical protein